jgi:hypothetical protein
MPTKRDRQEHESSKRPGPAAGEQSAEPLWGKSPPADGATSGSGELRRFEPVSDELVLAAVDRAERHREVQRDGVSWADIVAHLGFVRNGWTTLQLRPQRDALIAEGLLAAGRRLGFEVWGLTDAGRAHLEAARQTAPIGELPESPQHRAWRRARANSAERIDPLRANARRGAEEALALLDAHRRTRSDTWLLVASRLDGVYRQLGLVTYQLYEWAEPDDARADVDDYYDPGDEKLEPAMRGRLRSLRQFRRSQGNLEVDDEDLRAREASAGAIITVPAEMVSELRHGLHTVLGDAAQGVSRTTEQYGREGHPEWYAEHRERFERTWVLLDLIGWGEPKQPAAVRIDLRQHRRAASEALDVRLLVAEDDLEEADLVDAERAEHGEPSKREATTGRVVALREFAASVKDLLARLDARRERTAG